MTVVPFHTRFSIAAALALLLAGQALALGVGRISVGNEGGRRVLQVQTQGLAEPKLEALGDRMVISIPGGVRAMKTLKVGSDPVKQIRFGKNGADLRVVLDFSRKVEPVLGEVGAKGFSVDLGPAAQGASVPAPAAEEADDSTLSPAQAGYTYSIVDIALGGDEQHSELVISANGPASYKPAVREGGRVISLTFRNSSLAFSGDLGKLSDNSIQSITARQVNSGGEAQVKVEVRLPKKLDYALQRDQNQLLLRLERPVAEAKVPSRGDMDTRVSIDVQNADLVGVIKVLCEQAGFEYQFSREILNKTPPDSLVTAKVKDRPLREVADTLLAPVSARMLLQGNTLYFGTQAEVDEKKSRLPAVQRNYQPRYLTIKQAKEILVAHFKRDYEKKLGTDVAAEDPRDKSRLLLVGTSEDVSTVLAALARYDVPESGEASASSEAGGGGNKTQVFRLQYLDASHSNLITQSINQLYGEGETAPALYIDGATRTLVVTTQLKYLRKIEKLLARLDVRPSQVNIEGRIVEVNQTVSRQLGINWSTFQQQGANTTVDASFDSTLGVDFISQLSYSTITNGNTIQAQLQALINDRKADLVSAPNITVNDNEPALIETKDNLVTLRSTREVTGNTVVTTTEATTFEVPLSLAVTPKISGADRRVAMKIEFKLRTATGAPAVAGAPPPTSEQNAKTNVNVNSGDTAVIGGLVRQNNLFTERKVPILGDIPLLGMLFRFESESKDKKEVIIFITPSIVED